MRDLMHLKGQGDKESTGTLKTFRSLMELILTTNLCEAMFKAFRNAQDVTCMSVEAEDLVGTVLLALVIGTSFGLW